VKLGALVAIGLLALGGLARAQGTDPNAPTCGVARDLQLVSPAGLLHVLDPAAATIRRWWLTSGAAARPLTIEAGALAFAFLPARRSLIVAHADPQRLGLRTQDDRAAELPFATISADLGEICGLAATDDLVVVCVAHTHYVVLDASRRVVSEADVGALPEPNDPNAPLAHSWDGMAWDAAAETLFAIRTQGRFSAAIAVPLDAAGTLGEPEIVELGDPNGPALGDESLALSPDGSRLVAPDGLELSTDPLDFAVLPADAGGDAFLVGADVFHVGGAVGADCELSPGALDGASETLLHSGLIRSAAWQGRTWLLRGPAAAATLQSLSVGSGDLDRDRAPDAKDFFPLDRTTGSDWDRDGVEDPNDAIPTNATDWRDTDGDHVGDNADAFPKDPKEWKDSDHDGYGDHGDADPNNPLEHLDSDSDGTGDNSDAFKFDPLEQRDTDGDGVGDNGDAFLEIPALSLPPFGQTIATFDVAVTRGTGLAGFSPKAVTTSQVLTFYDDGRFSVCAPADCLAAKPLTGTFGVRWKHGKKLKLQLDTRSLSQLEKDFALSAAGLTPTDSTTPALTFYPKFVASAGVANLTKTGVTLTLRVRFAFKRDPPFSAGWRGAFSYRAKGTPAE
jgi:hypothetical protein